MTCLVLDDPAITAEDEGEHDRTEISKPGGCSLIQCVAHSLLKSSNKFDLISDSFGSISS